MQLREIVKTVFTHQQLTSDAEGQITRLVRADEVETPDLQALEQLMTALRLGLVQRGDEIAPSDCN